MDDDNDDDDSKADNKDDIKPHCSSVRGKGCLEPTGDEVGERRRLCVLADRDTYVEQQPTISTVTCICSVAKCQLAWIGGSLID